MTSEDLAQARQVADAVLYEGYLLYPYRASAQKNQQRFQFGVLMPPVYAEVDPSEHTSTQTECLLDCPDDAVVRVFVRFLQLQRRSGSGRQPWDEAVEHEDELAAPVLALLAGEVELPFHADAEQADEPRADSLGMIRRGRAAVRGILRLSARRTVGPYRTLRLRITMENHTDPGHDVPTRHDALPYALVAAHTIIGVTGGAFVSMVDPPEWAAAEVADCHNVNTWPVLAGPPDCRSLVLSSPIILYDHPEIAPESVGNLYDATEIDEILTLRTLALTDEEKAEARATDPRAAAVIDQVDGIQPEVMDRLHGAIRYLRAATGPASVPIMQTPTEQSPRAEDVPWWDPGADTSVSPETDQVVIGGIAVGRGSRVVMCPGSRRADAQDLFLVDREAQVEAVLRDVDGNVHLAVTPRDDPAADLHRSHGRFLYFAPDEVRPIEAAR